MPDTHTIETDVCICVVCLDLLEPADTCDLHKCDHGAQIHRACFNEWIDTAITDGRDVSCPICRTVILHKFSTSSNHDQSPGSPAEPDRRIAHDAYHYHFAAYKAFITCAMIGCISLMSFGMSAFEIVQLVYLAMLFLAVHTRNPRFMGVVISCYSLPLTVAIFSIFNISDEGGGRALAAENPAVWSMALHVTCMLLSCVLCILFYKTVGTNA